MICAEMPLAAARDGLFPARFGRLSARKVPAFGIIASTALASVAVVISYMGASGATVYTTLVLTTGITAAIPYAFSALAQIKWRWQDNQAVHTPRLVRDLSVATLALVFSLAFIYYSRNSGDTWYVVGPVPDGRWRFPARHPGLPRAARPDDPTRPATSVPLGATRRSRRERCRVDGEVGQLAPRTGRSGVGPERAGTR